MTCSCSVLEGPCHALVYLMVSSHRLFSWKPSYSINSFVCSRVLCTTYHPSLRCVSLLPSPVRHRMPCRALYNQEGLSRIAYTL